MSVVISPPTITRPVVIIVSHATRPSGSSRRTASRTVSETWSAILSGCPSVTDSDVKENARDMRARLADAEEGGEGRQVVAPRAERGERRQVRHPYRELHTASARSGTAAC